MAGQHDDGGRDAKGGTAFYGYLYDKQKPIPNPTPVLDALLRAIAQHIVRCDELMETHERMWLC